MEADTTGRISVTIESHAAKALWAAMMDDDDLANDYVSVAVVHALNHLVNQVGPESYCKEQWERLRLNLHAARKVLDECEGEMVARWNAYDDIPF